MPAGNPDDRSDQRAALWTNFARRKLGRLAAVLARSLQRDKLDGCCDVGGTSEGAAPIGGMPTLAAERVALARAPTPEAADLETGALIGHILERYHAVHRREIPELIRLARRVEAAHGGHPEAPIGLADLLSRVASEMEQHMKKEEDGLFPRIVAGETDVEAAIDLMRDEHDDHSKRLRQIETLTRAHTPPPDACGTWAALYAGTRKFSGDLLEHIELENAVLFPRLTGGSAG